MNKQNGLKIYFVLAFTSLLFSCKKEISYSTLNQTYQADKEEYSIIKKLGDLNFEAQFQPNYMIALNEYCAENKDCKEKIDEKKYESILSELGDISYFKFDLFVEEQSKAFFEQGMEEKKNYFLQRAQRDFFAVQGNDTVSALLYNFDYHKGISKKASINLGFKLKKENNTSFQLIFNAYEIQGGLLKFNFKNIDTSDKL